MNMNKYIDSGVCVRSTLAEIRNLQMSLDALHICNVSVFIEYANSVGQSNIHVSAVDPQLGNNATSPTVVASQQQHERSVYFITLAR